MTYKASEFLPLTPLLLRRAAAVLMRLDGLCAAVMFLDDSYDSSFEDSEAALKRLYCASEDQPWEVDDEGYLVRFGRPNRLSFDAGERRKCLLRMADWLESLERDV